MKKQSIFDKLTDPSLYTGSHKHRFDKDGKGLGKKGRTDNTGGVKDLSEITRPNLKTPSKTNRKPSSNQKSKPTTPSTNSAKKKKETPNRPKNQSIFDKLTDTSLYTGTHKHRFDSEGKGRGREGRVSVGRVTDLSQITRPNLNH